MRKGTTWVHIALPTTKATRGKTPVLLPKKFPGPGTRHATMQVSRAISLAAKKTEAVPALSAEATHQGRPLRGSGTPFSAKNNSPFNRGRKARQFLLPSLLFFGNATILINKNNEEIFYNKIC